MYIFHIVSYLSPVTDQVASQQFQAQYVTMEHKSMQESSLHSWYRQHS